MAQDLYLKINDDSVPGIWPIGAAAPKLLKLERFRHGVQAQVAPMRPSMTKAHMRQSYTVHQNFIIDRVIDNASPALFKACMAGTIFKTVEIYICIPEEEPLPPANGATLPTPFFTVRLSEVLIADYQYNSGVNQPVETLQLHYVSIEWKVRSYNFDTEKFGAAVTSDWDGQKNQLAQSSLFQPLGDPKTSFR